MARDVASCVALMQALAPGFESPAVGLDDLRVGVAWLEHADPLVRARVAEAAALFRAEPVDLPLAEYATYPVFMAEAADVHRELFSEHADEYGENVRTKIERSLAVSPQEVDRARVARSRYVDDFRAAMAGYDVVVTPTLECVAPPVGIGDLALRERLIRLTYPFNFVGAPALALPCGPAEDSLPASLSLAGDPGADAYVLGAGLALEAALSAST
jgi:Asp-tRNA(Asn)/Glu-tRNA(Gln) amidotransferase A subunit family amidase